MRIPKREVVEFFLKETLQKQKITSQAKLAEVLNEKLKRGDRDYAVTGKRARMIAIETPGVKVLISTKRGRKPKRCPSCSHSLRKVYMRNLRGKKLLVALRCQRCGYTGSEGKWVPSRYEFALE